MSDAGADEVDDPDETAFLRKLARVDDLPPPDAELRTGDRLGRFAIVKRIGAGGMGAVFEAKDETLGRSVALKVMRRASDEARARFIQEARAAAAVSHANLVVVHEVGEVDGRAFIVMELVRGGTLRARMQAKVSREEALRIIGEAARGVAAAHAAGIVHRDLKPENVMLGDDGHVKVVDFGVARLASSDAHAVTAMAVTGTGVVVGTPQYMSPEQALGRDIDARSDVYSFGVVAYELLTGQRPGPNPPPAKVSPSIDAVLARCLAADPKQRFADARAIVQALDAGRSRRRRWPLVLAAVTLLAVGLALVAWRIARAPAELANRRLVAAEDVHSSSAEATAEYRAGFQQLHDAMLFEAVQRFEHAVALDPSFAAAHLRLGVLKRFFHSREEAQRSFSTAVANRAQLDEHDQLLLQAVEPMVAREPFDYREAAARLLSVLDEMPGDAEALYYLGICYSELGEHARILPLLDTMQRSDATAPIVWSSRALTLLYLGDRAGAREAAIECRRVAPTQGSCAFELTKILDDSGRCEELETVLRAWLVASGGNPRVPRMIARVLLSTGWRVEPAQEMFAAGRALSPANARADLLDEDAYDIAWQTGDLATAERILRKWLEAGWDEKTALQLADLLEETDRRAEARTLAESYFAHQVPVSRGTSDQDLYNDRTGAFLAILYRGMDVSDPRPRARRDAWVEQLDKSIAGSYRGGIWAQARATGVRTHDEALDALDALKTFPAPLPPFFWFANIYGDLGRTFVLGDKPREALPYLERATKRCLDRDPRDYYYYGLAQQQLGEPVAACLAYKKLLQRWGKATTSVTVQDARAHAAALSCD